MTKIICIGSASKDIFFPTPGGVIIETPEELDSQEKLAFELGAKYQVEKIYEAPGGCAANVAQGLSRLGVDTSCYSKIGRDKTGTWIKEELEKEGVKTDLLNMDENCISDVSAIIVDEKTKDHIVFFNRDANDKLEIDIEKLKGAENIFISALNGDWEGHIDRILEAARENGSKIILNPGQRNIKDNPEKIIETIENSEILVLNKDEAIEILLSDMGDKENDILNDEVFLIGKLKEMGPKIVALTNGKEGAWVSDGRDIFFSKLVIKNPVDSLGAGDSFSSGFLSGILMGESLENSLRWGMANSTNVIMFYGAKEGLLNRGQIGEKIEDIDTEKLV